MIKQLPYIKIDYQKTTYFRYRYFKQQSCCKIEIEIHLHLNAIKFTRDSMLLVKYD